MSSSSQRPISILVLGAGELGTAILSSLATHPQYSSRSTRLALLRRTLHLPASLSRFNSDISLETGDLTGSPLPELSATIKKYDVVIHAAGYGAPPGTLLRVAQAAVEAGVKRFFPWQFGVDYAAIAAGHGAQGVQGSGHAELFGEMLAVRQLLAGQNGTSWTVVSTGLFMSYLFLREFGVVDLKERVVRALGSWEDKVTMTAAGDIGRMVAEMVYRPRDTENKVVHIGGDTVSYRDVADIVEEKFGGEFMRELWNREYLRKRLLEEPGDLMLKYQDVFGAGIGVSWDLDRTWNHQRGIKLTTLREYVEENKGRLADQTD